MRLRRIFAAGAGTVIVGGLALALAFGGTRSFAADEKEAGGAQAPTPVNDHSTPPRQQWSFYGPFGKFERAQLQRGYQVYQQVCSNCHSMKLVAFRDLTDGGGPAFSEAQVKALAATFKIKDGPNEAGEMFERPGRPSDYFPPPFPNPQAARAALGASPPDMSVLAKARDFERGFPLFVLDAITQYQEEGVDYIYALLNGYAKADDTNWNEFFPGHHIAMPPPLSDGLVNYTDGAPATVPQYAKDVSAFLMWAAEPKLEARKSLGFSVFIYLVVFAGLLYFVKKRIWAKVGAH
jgi:ubiquinol-cytochrome c reductase cytochrome c1 subunit